MSPTSTVEVDVDHHGQIAHLTIPGGLFHATVAADLVAAVSDIVEDRAIRAVTLGAHGDFCTGPGPDLDRIGQHPDPATALSRLRPPVIVSISGACRSVGLEIALTADVRICSPDATFAMNDITQGELPCWGGTQRLPRAIRPAEAAAMILLGVDLDAERARSLGLVHTVGEQPVRERDRLVELLLERGPLALELAKEAVHRGSEMPLRDGLRLEGDLNHLLAATEDRAEGLAAFFAKRPPDFTGR